MQTARNFSMLVSVEELSAQLSHAQIFDCRFALDDADAGLRAYRDGHIPHARYVHLERDLSGEVTARTGRHPLPRADAFAQTLRRWNFSRRNVAVAYDDAGGAIAARLWWMLRACGCEKVTLLDGGWQAWVRAGLEVARGDAHINVHADAQNAHAETVKFDSAQIVDAETVAAKLRAQKIALVDARAPQRFRGESEPLDARAGHVPGAVNFPFRENLDAHAKFLPRAKLAERFAPLRENHARGDVVHMCGSGVTACHNIFAMEYAGLPGAKLYPGSWSEWIRDPARGVAAGENG